jgi:hypothetical protein
VLRPPAVAGRFYPADPAELTAQIRRFVEQAHPGPKKKVRGCLVPHAGYVYSGHVAGAVYATIELPQHVVILGVRHFPRGEPVAILSSGAWRTPLGDATVDATLAERLRAACPLLREDAVAHATEHSLEVQIPFLQILAAGFTFVPVALGTLRFDDLVTVGEAVAEVLRNAKEEILLLTSSDMNHYESDAVTRRKDQHAIDRLLALDARGLFDTCAREDISMCGLAPAVSMLTALRLLGARQAELVRYATSGDLTGDRSEVVGYAGMIFT